MYVFNLSAFIGSHYLFHVRSPNELGAEVKVLPGRLLQVQQQRAVADLQVVLFNGLEIIWDLSQQT